MNKVVRMDFQKFPVGMSCEITRAGSCGFVIFGASGDLAQRKLLPSLSLLFDKKIVPKNFFVVGFARTKMEDSDFREKIRKNMPGIHEDFLSRVHYVYGDYEDDGSYAALKMKIEELDSVYGTENNFIFCLAVPPALYGDITGKLVGNGVMKKGFSGKPFHRIMIEKPFGRDYRSAVALNEHLLGYLDDSQIFRVDHYLGKDTVQNILVFRFANSIFEPVWNSKCVEYVQINVSEELGVENRAGYFDNTGLIRDMLQNHMFQLLSLVAMEAPSSYDAESVRNEKQKVFDSIAPVDIDRIEDCFVRGQYTDGKYPAYRKEPGIGAMSCTETFFTAKLFIDNDRWRGIPFYLKAGKRLDRKETSISIVFKNNTTGIFGDFNISDLEKHTRNILTFKIQPEQGVTLRFQAKVPGLKRCLAPLNLEFDYIDLYGAEAAGDYASVILDCILGDQMLFWRRDGIESTWKFLTPVLKYWETCERGMHFYPAGSRGPEEADRFIERNGHSWIEEGD
jgi:glucose-6-phosphate 1-dehydrogenase